MGGAGATNDPHLALQAAGMIPGVGEVADGADALLYLVQGENGNAALSAAAMLPAAGNAVTGARWAARGANATRSIVKEADKASELRTIAGRNRVSIQTPNGRLSVDLEGKPHHEKSLGRKVPTPHVKFETKHAGPDGRISYTSGPVREATHADLRIVERVLKMRGRGA